MFKITIGVILAVVVLAFVGTCTVYGGAIFGSVKDGISDATPASFDVRVANAKVNSLKNELIEDNRNLARLRRDIERSGEETAQVRSSITNLAAQIEAGAQVLNNSGDEFVINGNAFTRQQVERQVESYLAQRSSSRESLRRREENLIRLQNKLVEMESLIAQKRLQVQDYESQIAMLEIDVRFQSSADRYNVNAGNTEIQSIIDRLSDKVHINTIDGADSTINFVESPNDLTDRINAELGN